MAGRKTTRTKLAPAVREIGLSKTYKALLTGEIASRLRRSSSAALRTAAALRATSSKPARRRLVELGLLSAGSSNYGIEQ